MPRSPARSSRRSPCRKGRGKKKASPKQEANCKKFKRAVNLIKSLKRDKPRAKFRTLQKQAFAQVFNK